MNSSESCRVRLGGKIYPCDQVIEVLKKWVTPERLSRIERVISGRSKDLVTVMENIYDCGNTSAVMRSAEAFGFHLFHQIVENNSFREVRRVTQGAEKWLIQYHHKTTGDCMDCLKKQGYRIYVTDLRNGRPIDELSFNKPVALCFGNEKSGASEELIQQADERVYIPMEGFVQSFNISVAAALCFQHIHREHQGYREPRSHREHRGNKGSSLCDNERQQLLALYLYRSCGSKKLIEKCRFE